MRRYIFELTQLIWFKTRHVNLKTIFCIVYEFPFLALRVFDKINIKKSDGLAWPGRFITDIVFIVKTYIFPTLSLKLQKFPEIELLKTHTWLWKKVLHYKVTLSRSQLRQKIIHLFIPMQTDNSWIHFMRSVMCVFMSDP